MALHLQKLCVGVESAEQLSAWIDQRVAKNLAANQPVDQIHTTRMMPKRKQELLDGGSLYWVIKGQLQARQRLIDIRPFTDNEGIKRCDLVMEPKLILTRAHPKRPFQGWRYLKDADAPKDLSGEGDGGEDLPIELRNELMDLGLL